MANYRLIFALLFVFLLFFTGMLFVLNSSKSAKLEEADSLSSSVHRYLRIEDQRCRARPTDYQGVDECLRELIDKLEEVGDLEEEDFDNFDTRTNESGHLILVNEGRNSLDSDKFTLLLNKEVVDEGCVIQGSIDPGYTCRLDFDRECEKGDVLEVMYDQSRAYLKTC